MPRGYQIESGKYKASTDWSFVISSGLIPERMPGGPENTLKRRIK